MVRVLNKEGKELYQCDECGFEYEDRSLAEKCEAWCKENGACNLEITSQAINRGHNAHSFREQKNFSTGFFYFFVGLVSSLTFFLLLYWVLRIDSSITSLVASTYNNPFYFWPYLILTLGAVILFGVNISFLVYRWRKFGPPNIKNQSGTAVGSLIALLASACPVCGSTLLSIIGIFGGLAVFPFGGLELKTLSLAFLILPLWLTKKELKKLESGQCESGFCPLPRDYFLKEPDKMWLSGLFALFVILSAITWNMLQDEPIFAKLLNQNGIARQSKNIPGNDNFVPKNQEFIEELAAKVLPKEGFQSKIFLGDSIIKLTREGVIDREKFLKIYQDRGGLPKELENVLDKPSFEPILLTRENANYYINLFWPLGLSNFMELNKKSPILGESLFDFASTGGWSLGKEENGGVYFNKFRIVELTAEQEALVVKIAQNTYRPCCNNSTFFQDCNHGSALFGILQLGASQGLSEEELYREALAFNSFWFPNDYLQIALYFKAVKNIDWDKVDPKVVLGKEYSSISGFYQNVSSPLRKLGLVPQEEGNFGCGV